MKIVRMKIDNFKGIVGREYDMSPTIIAVLGENGMGKTSFMDAYNRIYSGQISDVNVRTGAGSASILAELENGVKISHVRKTSKMVKTPVTEHFLDGKRKTLDEVKLYLERYSGTNTEMLSVLSSSTMLQEMEPAALSRFLLHHLSCKVTGKEILDLINSAELKESELPGKWFQADKEYDNDVISSVHDSVSNERLLCGRDVKSYRAYIDNYSGYLPPEGRTAEIVDQEIMDLMKQIAAVEEAKKSYQKQQKLLESMKKTQERYQQVVIEFNTLKDAKKPDGSDKKIREGISKLDTDISLLQENIIKAEKDIEFYRKVMANIEKGICPIYEKMRCSTDWSGFKTEFSKNVKTSQKLIDQNKKAIEAKKREKKKLEEDLDAYQKNAIRFEKKAQLYTEYTNLRDNMPKHEEVTEVKDVADPTEQKSRLAALKKERKLLDSYADYQKKQKALAEAEKKYALLDALCKELDPKGNVITSIVNRYVKKFESICKQTASTYRHGFEIRFYMNKGLHVYCRPRAGMPLVEFKNASSGEKACIMVSLVDMINAMTGNRILALDDIEKLDSEMLDAVLNLITQPAFSERYDNIILAGVGHEDTLDAIRKHGITIIN